jgi:transcriptional regulator with XRE-family HTH domain/quercetin dioxygenase-like cupin family protein
MEQKENNEELLRIIGKKIREIRQNKNMKIIDLANKTDLSVSLISQVERGIISPSMDSLIKIATAIEVPISTLFLNEDSYEEESSPLPMRPKDIPSPTTQSNHFILTPVELHDQSPVVRKKERKRLSPAKGINFQLLNPNLNGPIEFIYNEYEPNVSTKFYTHPGSECGLILSGELIVQINDDIYHLNEGDSITFNSTDRHLKKNVSSKKCCCVWANVPPWF